MSQQLFRDEKKKTDFVSEFGGKRIPLRAAVFGCSVPIDYRAGRDETVEEGWREGGARWNEGVRDG